MFKMGSKEYYQEHKEKWKEYHKGRENYDKEYRNRPEVKARKKEFHKRYYQEHKKEIKEYKQKYYQEHKKEINKKNIKNYYKNRSNDVKPKFRIDKRKEEILDLYINEEKGMKEISNLMNCDFDVIKRILRGEGVRLKPQRDYLIGRIPWNKNKKGIYSKETLEKIRKARAKQILPKKDTKIEVKIQNFLKKLGISFFTHQYMKIEHGYQCDILIPSINLVIECDGDYWHKYPIGNDLDHVRLLQNGFKVLRLWECEIIPMKIQDFKKILKLNH